MNSALPAVIKAAHDLVEAVTSDDSGRLVAGIWMGGNGGLLGRDTIKAADRLRLALDAFDQAEATAGEAGQ